MNDRPFSLQPRPPPGRGPQSITEFIRRVNAEPGGFRGINTAELRAQLLNRQQNGDGDNDAHGDDRDIDMTGASSEAGSDVAETKDVAIARDELLRAVHQTHQTSMFALDFVSLLLSKENPAQAVATFSPGLRDMVGIGTLGATMLAAPTVLTQARVPDNKMVAIGKRLMDLNKAADTALAASKRLQREIGYETKYWSEVLAVSERGWQTFRMPNEPQTMGVKFGFSNAAPEFKLNSIAPMRRAADGSVRLEPGKMARGSKRLRVSILENGVVVGRSSLPRPLPPDAPLQDRVKEARDTIFAQELWQEINRERRGLNTRTIGFEGSVVACPLDATRSASIQLATLDEEEAAAEDRSGEQDALADWLCTTFNLLLSNSHRANEQRRSERSLDKGPAPPYSILTPLVTYFEYDKCVQQCAQKLAAFIAVLRGSGLGGTVTMKEPPLAPFPTVPASEALAAALLKPPPVQFDVALTPVGRVRILLRPTTYTSSGAASFSVFLLPTGMRGVQNPLLALSPLGVEEFPRMEALFAYLYSAVPCALAAAYLRLAVKAAEKPALDSASAAAPPPRWTIHDSRKGIVDVETGEYGVHFDCGPNPSTGNVELRVAWDSLEDAEGGGKKKVHMDWTWPGTGANINTVLKKLLSSGPPEADD
ncbi:uncharacterized protein THITE_2112931 [Thermothielavioides terrestris NRRL 8126]|uniref:Mediator of RNA polymerase II transcription subunit 17 n=1 Tax=Thermothielavioides terrestris (strain ATCC 38088 / NRRL 8126) TaxID=578455 RepID=G2R0Z7_THETT|nr:uncharacterized protein THITE_2112931 [Thermothielavioides terrestris NRRL 8126]AEO65691.1 hypothetical protein THITE_2112931 [Thermothielavioides terrestris NRRL 8126]